MSYIKIDHWYVRDNELSISLMRFHVSIDTVLENNDIIFKLTVNNSNIEKLYLDFKSLESAINFTENIISVSNDYDEILEKYNKLSNSNLLSFRKLY